MKVVIFVFSLILLNFSQTNGYTAEDNVKGSINFSFDLYRTLYEHNENLVVSPYSLRILLGIIYQGTYDAAHSELHDKVYFGENSATLNKQKLAIRKFSSSPNVKIANKMYLREGFSIRPDFKQVVEKFKSEVELIDFSQSTTVANTMNQWVEENTNGLIKDLVNADMMTPDTAFFIINTLYFKAKWENQFPPTNSFTREFHGYDKEYTIEYMHEDGSYKWNQNDEFKVTVVEIPYKPESNFVFWIILPDENSNIRDISSKLNNNFIGTIDTSMHNGRILLSLPIFSIESSIDLKKAMEKMGITTIFTRGQMNILSDGSPPIAISDVRQKTKITVNTEGTEAAAASFGKPYFMSLPPVITADRPFIYMVMTADTKEPVFIGHYVKP